MKKIGIFFSLCFFWVLNPLSADDEPFTISLGYILESAVDIEDHVDFVSLAQGGDIYRIGDGVQSFSAIRSVTHFYMNAYETTYDLWYYVRDIAENELDYTFQHAGQEGSSGKRGNNPTAEGLFQPVTTISWRDAVVWCNAFSEIMNRNPAYTYEGEVLRDATDAAKIDLATCDFSANGYRLPTEAEWEYAARKIVGKSGPSSFIPGDRDSGATWNYETIRIAHEQSLLSNIENNSPIFEIGSANVATANSLLGPLSHPKSGQENYAGLYDMSGNVLEFCWDWFSDYTPIPSESTVGTERVLRGGSWSEYASFTFAGDRYAYNPGEAYNYMGFRFCTNEL